MESHLSVMVVLKGGAGSGFFGHKGRPGEEGGSLPKSVNNSKGIDYDEWYKDAAVTFINNLTRSGGYKEVTLSSEARGILKQTVGDKPLKVYRGIGIPNKILTEEQQVIVENLKPGDRTPDFLAKVGNKFASYSKLKSIANYYSEGRYSIIIKTIVPVENIIVDLEKISDTPLKSEFENAPLIYFQEDKEVIVEEPVESTILSVKINTGRHKEITVVLKGGAGSGFHGHKGRPGKQGGSLPEGTVAAKKIREPKFLNAENMSDEDKARIKTELAELADRLGFPVDKIAYFNHDAPAFKVGDNNYETAMCYSPKLGEITIYPGSMLIEDGIPHINAPLVAHEVMHHRFYLFEKQLHKQEALINKLGVGLDDNPVLNNDFSLKSEFTEQYWAVDIKHRYYQYGDMRELLYQIPVTDYGKSYIEVARKSIYGVDMSRAIGENLAEVAAYSDNPNVFVSTRWSKLYNEINQSLYTHKLIPKYVPLVRSDNG